VISRRAFLSGAVTLLAAPLAALAQQQGKVWRVGFFYFGSHQSALETGRYAGFIQGMRERGYIEGKNFVLEARYADGKTERLPALAAELVQSKVDVIVTTGTPVNHAARKATAAVPIVMTVAIDPVGEGLAASLARPGGNLTGLSNVTVELGGKHVEIMKSLVPALSRVAVLWNSGNPGHTATVKAVESAAQTFAVRVLAFDGRRADDIEKSFPEMTRGNAQAVLVLGDAFFVQHQRQIAGLALKHALPSLSISREFPEVGGLISYGPDIKDNFRRAATYVDKILKGATPADLPVEQPTKFELVINLKTAKALGLTIPPSLLARADQVIE
jgi:putative ABC transport system substrate-binding protein